MREEELLEKINEALSQNDEESVLTLLNEYLDIADLYHAEGDVCEALRIYREVKPHFVRMLPDDSLMLSTFFCNISVLFQELGDLQSSIDSIEQALKPAILSGNTFEVAKIRLNLANALTGLDDFERAENEAREVCEALEQTENIDAHYAAALYILGLCAIQRREKESARSYLERAGEIMEISCGRNEYYYRINDALKMLDKLIGPDGNFSGRGMDIARKLYEEEFKPLLQKELPEYVSKVAAGLVGFGSECLQYDDEASRDHDWGPGFCVWVSGETYEEVGAKLEDIYNRLPKEYMGYKTARKVSRHKRRGVFVIEDFYREVLGVYPYEDAMDTIPDYSLSNSVNGCVFTDPEGVFTQIRAKLAAGYPEEILLRKMAESAYGFSQCAIYNCTRAMEREDALTASVMMANGVKEAMKLAHFLAGVYPPHDKWLFRSVGDLYPDGQLVFLLKHSMESKDARPLGEYLAGLMCDKGYISGRDAEIGKYRDELINKADEIKNNAKKS